MASCRLCGQTIRFDKEFKSEYTGKLIPLEEKADERHNCPEWKAQHRHYYHCRDCDAEILQKEQHPNNNDRATQNADDRKDKLSSVGEEWFPLDKLRIEAYRILQRILIMRKYFMDIDADVVPAQYFGLSHKRFMLAFSR